MRHDLDRFFIYCRWQALLGSETMASRCPEARMALHLELLFPDDG